MTARIPVMVADAFELRAEFDRLADAGEWDKADEELSPAIDRTMNAIYAAPLASASDVGALLRGVLLFGGSQMDPTDAAQIERAAEHLEAVPAEDAALLAYQRRLAATNAEYAALPQNAPRRVWRPLWRRMRWLERRIASTPAAGMRGVTVKLRVALRAGTGHGAQPETCLADALATMERLTAIDAPEEEPSR